MDRIRRKLLGGGLVAGATLGLAKAAQAQTGLAQGVPSVSHPPELAPPPQIPSQTPSGKPDAAPQPAAYTTAKPKPAPVAQDWANLHRYHDANDTARALTAEARKVVMMGDSITDNWPGMSQDFFAANGLIGRGISGQTTAQMVVRFWPEVIELKPRVVHIMAGTNDIAENLDPYDFAQTTRNLLAMATMASACNIRVVMASVPPATSFAWKPDRGNQVEQIKALNGWISALCKEKGFVYADYWPVLATADGSLKAELGLDSVHPNPAGYAVMGPVALAATRKAAGWK